MNAQILALTAEIRKGTIIRLMGKSDLEVGLEALARIAQENGS